MASEKNEMTQADDMIIEQAYQHLLRGYLESNHRKKVELIEKAYKFAREAHAGVRRRSGEPYIMHPLAVATIVSREIGLGSTSICAALLHDVVEDTEFTIEDIELQFGSKIAYLVNGLTKISGGIFGENASAQAENFRKLLLTMSNDIRVILIKIADRLHNMRTLEHMPAAKQFKIAGETLYIYAPLAQRLGLFAIKTELEDLSFKYEHPDTYRIIGEQIASTEKARNEIFERFAAPIREKLDKMGLVYEFKVRVKSRYSIWRKMETKKIPFEEVYDLYAARIVFECDNEANENKLCWSIYSEISDLYKLHPDRTRNWLNNSKANGYRALHLTAMGPDGKWIEVQIRSRHMDDLAERGFAAHWKYKIGEGEEESELAVWLQTIEDILKNPEPNALDFLDTIKLNLFAAEIVVFTPKGETITLPKDSSVLDMAFTLHTEIGTHCIAAKVNHNLVPISHKLASGDQVEIITSKSQQPKPEWEKCLVTAKGKNRLRAALRHDRRVIIDRGEQMFNEFLLSNELTSSNETLTRVIALNKVQNKEELFFKIGNNEIALTQQLLKQLKPGGFFNKWLHLGGKPKEDESAETSKIDTKKVYELKTVDGKPNYKLANCCHPIPGDDVLGYINNRNEVVVHKMDCPMATRFKIGEGNRLVQTKWEDSSQKFLVTMRVEGLDRMGILQEIIYLISTYLAIDMRRLNIKANEGVFDCELDVLVEDKEVVNKLCKRLKRVKGVSSVVRIS